MPAIDDRPFWLNQDQRFFDALVAADAASLEQLLAEDFILVAVHDGSIVTKSDLIGVIGSGALKFPAVTAHPDEAIVRRAGDVVIVVGRTSMNFTDPEGIPVATSSRYTHVFQLDAVAGWRLVSAQGTHIA